MRTLTVFNFLSLNGYYKGPGNNTGWHRHGSEESLYSEQMMTRQNTLLFGRVTYELMAAYWATSMAAQDHPIVAKGMGKAEKIVFSNTLTQADWHNTRILNGDIISSIKELKRSTGPDLALLGSGTILSQFAEHDLIDAYEFMIDPLALPEGTTVFSGISRQIRLELTGTRAFSSGTVLLSYRPLR